jgi:hypothetical protein
MEYDRMKKSHPLKFGKFSKKRKANPEFRNDCNTLLSEVQVRFPSRPSSSSTILIMHTASRPNPPLVRTPTLRTEWQQNTHQTPPLTVLLQSLLARPTPHPHTRPRKQREFTQSLVPKLGRAKGRQEEGTKSIVFRCSNLAAAATTTTDDDE